MFTNCEKMKCKGVDKWKPKTKSKKSMQKCLIIQKYGIFHLGIKNKFLFIIIYKILVQLIYSM